MSRKDPALTTRPHPPRLPSQVMEAAAQLSTATLHEAGKKIGALPSAIRPLSPSMRVCGQALTVHSPPGDNLWLHRALVVSQPGDVLVVFANQAYEHGYWGEIMATMAQARGVAGLVIDACVRDGALMQAMGFPVFARGLCIQGTGKDFGATGWINHPVMIGDITVHAGDLVVGDGDGVVVIPQAQASAIVQAGQQRDREEAKIMARLKAGETTMAVYGWGT